MLAVQRVSRRADVHEGTLQALNIVLLESNTEVEHLGRRRRRTLDESDGRTGALLAVPDPRLRVLQATPEQFRAVRIALDP